MNGTGIPYRVAPENVALVKEFLDGAGLAGETFRYFARRPLDVVRQHVCTWLLMSDGHPVGYGHLDRDGDTVWLGLAVQEAHQGAGIGRAMMAVLIAAARANGITRLHLSVDRDNARAIHLYRAFGFHEIRPAGDPLFFVCDLSPVARAVVSSAAFPRMSIESMIEATAQAGFGMEFSSGLPHDPAAEELFLSARIPRFAHNYFPAPEVPFVINLASSDAVSRQRSIDHCVHGMHLSAAVGAPFFSAHAGFAIEVAPQQLGGHPLARVSSSNDAAWERFVSAIREILAATFHVPVGLLIENHVVAPVNRRADGTHPLLCADAEECLGLVRTVGDGRLGLLCDTGHWKVTSRTLGFDRADAVTATMPHVRCVHHSDNDGVVDDNRPFDDRYWFLPLMPAATHAVHVLETRENDPAELARMNDLLFAPARRRS